MKEDNVFLTPSGKLWNSYQRPKHLCFTGETIHEIISPDKTEFVVSIGLQDKRPLIIKS